MPRIGLALAAALIICANPDSARRNGHGASASTNFTSTYTDLTTDKGCRRESEEDSPEGSDTPLVCPGPGGYRIRISYAAIGAYASVEMDGGFSVQLAEQAAHFNDGRKVEWRLANDRPFAVILRVAKYREARGDPEEDFTEKNKTGEMLVVRGLKGQEHIGFEVDTRKTADANDLARRRAAGSFRRG